MFEATLTNSEEYSVPDNNNFAEICKKGDLTGIKAALDSGTDPCALDSNGWSALHYAVEQKTIEVLQTILDSGKVTNIDTVTTTGIITPLLKACERGNVQCAKCLVENGANVKAKTENEWNVLTNSVKSKKLEMVRECLSWPGVSVHARGGYKNTALMEASAKNLPGIVKVLIRKGADVNATNVWGISALYYARNNQVIKNLLISQRNVTNKVKNVASIHAVIKDVFPKITEECMSSIFQPFRSKEIDINAESLQNLIIPEETKFRDILDEMEYKLLHEAIMIRIAKEEIDLFPRE